MNHEAADRYVAFTSKLARRAEANDPQLGVLKQRVRDTTKAMVGGPQKDLERLIKEHDAACHELKRYSETKTLA